MMGKLLTNNYLFFIISVLAFAIAICTRTIGLDWQTLITLLLYAALTIKTLTVRNTGVSILVLSAPFLILLAPLHIINYTKTQISLPGTIAFPIGILFGYLIYISSKFYKPFFITGLCCIALFMYFKGYSLWLNKISFGTFLSIIDEPVPPTLIFDKNVPKLILLSHKE